MPFASMSNVTSICGTPRGAGRMPSRMKRPERLVVRRPSRARPGATWISTDGWLSAAVENTWLLLVGIVVLRGMSGVATPPSVSMPSVSGVTSSSRTSRTSPLSTPAWIAAPIGDDLVRVHALVRLLAEELLHLLLHQRHARLAADQHDLVDLAGGHAGVLRAPACTGRACARPGRRRAARASRASA